MSTAQRWISNFLNLFFPNTAEPEVLWPWGKITAVLALFALLGGLYASLS